jgi:hypothetical protein
MGPILTSMPALLTPWQKISPGHPPIVQNHISGTQIQSPENFRKIWESGLFLLWRKGELFDKRGDRCEYDPNSNNPGRYSTMNPDEVMYGDHRPRVSKRVRGFLLQTMRFVSDFTDVYEQC